MRWLMLFFVLLAGTLSAQSEIWVLHQNPAPWGPRCVRHVQEFNGRLWLMGGKYGVRDVWSSADGVNWQLEVANGPWHAMYSFASAVHNGRLWLLGGHDGYSGTSREVWSSADGINWVQHPTPGWSARQYHTAASLGGKLFIFGGQGKVNGCAYSFAEVWSTTDGSQWTLETSEPGWEGRYCHATCLHNGEIWLSGGGDNGYFADVWTSTDGVNWTRKSTSPPWPARVQHTMTSHDGKVYVIAGQAQQPTREVWHSTDGVSWQRDSDGPWHTRAEHGAVSYLGRLWLFGGYEGAPYWGYSAEVISFGTNWQGESLPWSPPQPPVIDWPDGFCEVQEDPPARGDAGCAAGSGALLVWPLALLVLRRRRR